MATECGVCGWEAPRGEQDRWVCLGYLDTPWSAELARETLKSLGIPVVVQSRDGYFGSVGLTLTPFFKKGRHQFTISVPAAQAAEAAQNLDLTLGEQWIKGDDE
ncbi:MAG: hypothetical protein ABIE70_13175 [bacterium]